MEWQISYLSDKDIMLAKIAGLCSPTNTLPMIKAIWEEAQINSCFKCLMDARGAERYYRTVDYYNRPNLYRSLGINRSVSIAVLFPGIGRKERFYENVCRNNGFNVSIFSDIDAAMAWLTSVPERSNH